MKTRADVERSLLSKASTDDEFRALLLADPHKAISDAVGIELPERIDLTVHEEDSTSFHLVLPAADQLTASELATVAGGRGGNW